jgi:hypothetical protein
VRHTTAALFEALLIIAVIAALVIGAAAIGGTVPAGAQSVFAARGGNAGTNGHGGSSIWIESTTVRTVDGSLAFGSTVAFGYSSDTAQSIQLQCSQSGVLVFADSRMLSESGSGYGESFAIGPSLAWTGGAADCTALLGHRSNNGRYFVEASVDFAVTE